MKKFLSTLGIGLFALIVCLFSNTGMAQHLRTTGYFKLVVFGDSLSAGYKVEPQNSFVSKLQKALYNSGYHSVVVFNNSKSGETTAGGLRRLPGVLEKEKPNGIIIELGINDVFQGLGLGEAERNLQKMIELCQSKKVPVLLVGMKAPPYAGIIYQQKFDKMYVSLAKKYNILLYPFFMKGLIEMESDSAKMNSNYILNDKIHPNPQGIDLMVKNILPYVAEFLKENKILPSLRR